MAYPHPLFPLKNWYVIFQCEIERVEGVKCVMSSYIVPTLLVYKVMIT